MRGWSCGYGQCVAAALAAVVLLVGDWLPADGTHREVALPTARAGGDRLASVARGTATPVPPARATSQPSEHQTPPGAPAKNEAPPEPAADPPSHSSQVAAAAALRGLASWYGGVDGFAPEDTMANGSPFYPDDPTIAAANDWPLGTWLTVCHQATCIDVRVCDRGAFGHAIDLSRGAFALLAPLDRGVIEVTIQETASGQ